ncbi:MAG: diacylglycerol kinase family lipid kinase [Anaerolineaceae bacterium]|nr:diacylglycerol kinase family lipid kinase [Anaerolineaceae bacterium]
MPYQKIRLIYNPVANQGRTLPVASSLCPIVEQHEHAVWVETGCPGHAAELAQAAAEEGCDLVIAIGGDGTVHEVVNGLMRVPVEKRPTFGIIPIGTGNDFAFSLNTPANPENALCKVLAGTPHPVDIGRIEDGSGRTEYFSNAVGIGFDAIVVIHSRNVPVLKGFAVYFIAVLRTLIFNHHPFTLKMQTADTMEERSLLMLAICNGQREGGGFNLAPEGRNDDGWLDTVALHRVTRSKLLLRTLVPFLKGTHQSLPHVSMNKIRKLSIQSDRPLIIHTDGEIYAGFGTNVHQLKFEILPGALYASY